jgi:hypothetical protein
MGEHSSEKNESHKKKLAKWFKMSTMNRLPIGYYKKRKE